MGHSFGGTFAQMLVDAGLGSAGVSIDGAGVKGVNALPFSEFRSTVAVLKDPLNVHRAVPLTHKQFTMPSPTRLMRTHRRLHMTVTRSPRRRGSCSREGLPP